MNRTLFATMLTALLLLAAGGSPLHAQCRPIPPLHVEGKNVVDPQGNPVVLHGVGLQPNNYWYHCDDWGKTYDLQGRRLDQPGRGISIVRKADGLTMKIIRQ